MTASAPPIASTRHPRSALIACTVLHAFTHAYSVMLVPLYLLMVSSLRLGGVKQASLIVTLYGLSYWLGSYPAGVLADRHNRKNLLGWALIVNAAMVLGMGLAHDYWVLVATAIMGGLAGSVYHPAANALVASHYPKSPGLAVGIIGIGSGIGFFVGPQYSGWRAETGWHLQGIFNWQVPLIELAIAGFVAGVLTLIFVQEAPHVVAAAGRARVAMPPGLRRRVLMLSGFLGARDFAAISASTLVSLFLQRAHGLGPRHAGLALGLFSLSGIIINPGSVWLSGHKRRIPTLLVVLSLAGIAIAVVPHLPLAGVFTALTIYYGLQLASFSVTEAALMERLGDEVRGRALGQSLMITGTLGAAGPWVMGWWVDRMGASSTASATYGSAFLLLGILMAMASLSLPLLKRLGPVHGSGGH